MPRNDDLSKMSNVDKTKARLESAYGKLSDVPKNQYKEVIEYAHNLDAPQAKTSRKKTNKRTISKRSGGK